MKQKHNNLTRRSKCAVIFTLLIILSLLQSTNFLSAKNAKHNISFTIDQILSLPFASNLISANGVAKIAWVQYSKGSRNIWVAESPAYEGRQVTSYDGDNGQVISNLQFTPDNQSVVYVYGGSPNRRGEIPNPLSLAEGAKQEIWIVNIEAGKPRNLAQGSSPLVSPTGKLIAFIRKGQVWSVSLADSSQPEQFFKIRGSAGDLRWSPEGNFLAFTSRRENHSFIAIYSLVTKKLKYLTPSVDRDNNPVWSPDGRFVAFLRIPNERQRLPFEPRRSALPWSIIVAKVESGECSVVWTAPEGVGSAFSSIASDNQIFWGESDRLIFPWEGDGWKHLYSLSATGGKPQLLTPGEFEVQYVSLSPDGREVFYDSNQNDIDRKHVWSVSVTGGKPKQITTGKSIEWSPVKVAQDKAVAFITSAAKEPAHIAVIRNGRKKQPLKLESFWQKFPLQKLVTPEKIILSATDGKDIHGQLFLPSNIKQGKKYPALLFFHGGSRRQMLLGFHHRQYYHNAYAFNQFLANKGYIVLSVNYRSGIGYGLDFREALNYGARGASEFNDVMGAGLYLRSRPDVDPNRIGLWGGSYGGYLTALGLARASDLFAAGVDLHGVHDWNVVIRNFVPGYNPAKRAESARLAFESSPMFSIQNWRSPVLVIHGDDDRNVPFSETVDLVEALRKQGVEVEQLIFPDEVHGFLLYKSWLAAYCAAADFFDRKLKF